jgi:fatty-acyl-CoA synthase
MLREWVPDPHGGVAVLSSNRPEAFYLWTAAAVVGRRFTALHPYSAVGDHLAVLADAEPALVLVDDVTARRSAGLLAAVADRVPVMSVGPVDGLPDALAELDRHSDAPVELRPPGPEPVSLAYTGGTTGRPRGVMRSDRAWSAATIGCLADWDWPAGPRLLVVNPMTHGTGVMICPTLLRGGTVILEPGFDAATFPEVARRTRASITFLVPTMLHRLVRRGDGGPSPLRTVVYGGAPMPVPEIRAALAHLGPVLMQIYGQAEAPMQITVLRRGEHADPAALASCGRPVSSVQVTVRAADGRELPPGETGEVCVRGPVVMDGYWRREAETARALRDGWLWTGDLGRFDETGRLFLVGRVKDMVISGGFNVFPAEVETALLTHPDVAQAAAFGLPDPEWGERLVAAVVPRAGAAPPDPDALRAHVRDRKGPMLTPKEVHVVAELPTTAVGKVDKRELARRCRAGVG